MALAVVLSVTPLTPPKYCAVHKTLDYCYQQAGKDGGSKEVDH